MKHLLLIGNIDGHSVPLLKYAGKLCKEMKLKLHILQIEKENDPILLSSPYYYNKVGFGTDQKLAGKKRELETFVQSNTKDSIDTEWLSYKLLQGNIEKCLDTFINDEKIDLLLVRKAIFNNTGIHQNKTFGKVLMNVSDIPILIIPQNHVFKKFNRMVYFTVFSETDLNNILWLAMNFPTMKIDLIHFSKEDESIENKKWLKYLKTETPDASVSFKRLDETMSEFIKKTANKMDSKYDLL